MNVSDVLSPCQFVIDCTPLLDLEMTTSLGASSATLAHASLNNDAKVSDPDLLVLGFQELDLSTEALLYATSTVREDAWVEAILAGLGERGILYEKVSCFIYLSTAIRYIMSVSSLPNSWLAC